MSEKKLEVITAVTVRDYTASTLHSMAELANIAFESHKAQSFIDSVSSAVAPHWHEQALRVEKSIRDDAEHQGKNDAEIGKACRTVFQGLVESEIARLKSTTSWEGTKLPDVADVAYRKLMRCWEMGGSMLKCLTISACEKFSAERGKEVRAKAADDYRKKVEAEIIEANGGKVPTEPSIAARPAFSDEIELLMPTLIKAIAEAEKVNASTARDLVNSAITKLNNVVAHAAKNSTAAVLNKAA